MRNMIRALFKIVELVDVALKTKVKIHNERVFTSVSGITKFKQLSHYVLRENHLEKHALKKNVLNKSTLKDISPIRTIVHQLLVKTKIATSVLLLLSVVGCATQKVEQEQSPVIAKSTQVKLSQQLDTLLKRTESHNNIGLKRYLQSVRSNNKDLRALQHTVSIARLNEKILAADGVPQLDLSISQQKNKATAALKGVASVAVNARWQLDIWGKLSDEKQALLLQGEQRELEYRRAHGKLMSKGMQAWWGYLSYRRQLAIMIDRIQQLQSLAAITQERFLDGEVAYADVVKQREASGLLQEQYQTLLAQQAASLHRLNILRGFSPNAVLKVPEEFSWPELQPAVLTVAASSLLHRPDIQAAFKRVLALDAQTRAANKALLPRLTISAGLNQQGSVLADALSGKIIWQLLGGISQTLFDGERLRNIAKRKSREAESSLFQYEQVVLNALEEVENTLSQDVMFSKQLASVNVRREEGAKYLASVKDQYRNGEVNLTQFIAAKSHDLSLETNSVVAREKYLNNRISLALSIGKIFESERK